MSDHISAEKEIQLAGRYAQRAVRNTTLLQMPSFRFRARLPTEPLHIGYVSSNFGNHTIGHMMQSTIGSHNPKRVKITCYSLAPDDLSEEHRRFRHNAQHFKDISQMGPGDAAQLIHSDRVHVLIDLNGYSGGSRTEIFALKPAPLQISAMGYPGTLGADFIQYKLVDPMTVPPNTATRERFTEKMLYMPHTFVATDHLEMAQHVKNKKNCPTRAVFGIPDDKIVFGCFHQLFKIDPEIFACWMRAMKRVPGSVLWLLRFPGLGEPNIRAEAKAHGIDPTRIYFSDVLPRNEHLSRIYLGKFFMNVFFLFLDTVLVSFVVVVVFFFCFWLISEGLIFHIIAKTLTTHNLFFLFFVFSLFCFFFLFFSFFFLIVDIMLDTPTYNGCSTVADSLWGATPMISMAVDRMCSRMGASVLNAGGCQDLVTHTLEQYEELAVELAKDSKKLWKIREQLEEARDISPLFNTKKWVRDFEQCLEMAWSRYEQGQAPDDIGVEASTPFKLDLLGKGEEDVGGKDKKRLLTVDN